MIARLAKLKELRHNVAHQVEKAKKKLEFASQLIEGHDERERAEEGETLIKGTQYYKDLCTLDVEKIKAGLDEEIAAAEKQIAEWRLNKKQRLMERLAQMFASVEGGKILELALSQSGIA
jgi:hypothetical protein